MADQPEAQKLLAHKPPDYGGAEAAPEAKGAESAGGDRCESEGAGSRFFPLAPFALLGPAQAFIPSTWRRIVSVPHLVLLVGILTCVTMALNTALSAYRMKGMCRTDTCEGRFMPLIFVVFCLFYFMSTIQQYDEALQIKQKELQKLKLQCEQQYNETVSEMEGFLNRAIDNQVVLAERNFESQRRDFSRFLKRYEKSLSQEAADDAVPPFRGLVLQWLLVFAECSIDPIRKPLKVLEAEELDECKSVGDVAVYTDERVQRAEVKFVTAQREKDKKELSQQRSVFKAVVTTQKADLKKRQTLCGSVPTFGELDIEDGVKQAPADDAAGEYRWMQWGRSKAFGARADPETGSFPYELSLGFVTVLLLSGDHLRLILGFFTGWAVVALELRWIFLHSPGHAARAARDSGQGATSLLGVLQSSEIVPELLKMKVNWLLLAQVLVCLVCISFVLHQFLDMDIIQQLELQLRELQAKKKQVDEKREMLVGFFDAVQRLADVWTHRTVTRLELLKHLQEKLRDAPPGEHAFLMGVMNEKVETLESSIPALEQWASEELISAEKKKLFGKAIADLYEDRGDLQATLSIMDEKSMQIKAALADQPPEPALAQQATSDGLAAKDPHKPGDQVEYLSASQGRWVPATVQRRNPLTGLYDLDCKDDVPPEKIREVKQSASWFAW